MNWIIRNGYIENPEGDGLRIEGISGGLIEDITVVDAGGSGIVLSGCSNMTVSNAAVHGTSAPERMKLEDLLQRVADRVQELPKSDRKTAHIVLDQIRQDQSTSNVQKCFRFLHDLTVQVSGSTIANILSPFLM